MTIRQDLVSAHPLEGYGIRIASVSSDMSRFPVILLTVYLGGCFWLSATTPNNSEQPAVVHSTLRVESNPTGATVVVDGDQQWIAPIDMELRPGTHHLLLNLKGYHDAARSVDLSAGKTQAVKVSLVSLPASQPESLQATLKIESTPAGATIVVDEDQQWIAPIDMKLPAGNHRLKFQLKGYRDAIRSADLKAGETQVLSVSLQALPLKEKSKLNLEVVYLVVFAFAGLVLATIALLRRKSSTLRPQSMHKPEDTPTAELQFNTMGVTPSRTPTPLDGKAIEAIQKKARKLPETAPRDLNGYELVGILGRGGMGTTFLAKRKRDGLAVAVKVPHDHLLEHAEFIQRFLREGSIGSTLHHPHIIRILEAGQANDKPFIAMELLHGETLEALLRNKDHLSLMDSFGIARDIAGALDYAGLKGIVHRDLKPENIMILEQGGLKVMDFGIAHLVDCPGLTSSEAYLGTPSYSAPEATGGRQVDQQSDLYSLGIILYRMLTGQLPFYSKDPLEILEMHRNQSLPPFPKELRLPLAAFRLVEKLTQKGRSERYANAEAFLIDLNQVLNQLAA